MMAKNQVAFRERARRRAVLVSAVLALCVSGVATAQINSNQVRQRYDKNTKTTDIDDSIKQMSSADPIKRLDAVRALGASKDDKALPYLIGAMGDSDMRVQVKAIHVVGDMRATDATPVLVQYLFLRTTSTEMKQLILASLGKIGDARAAQPVVEFLQRDLDETTRGTAIFALGEIGSSDAVPTLERIAQNDEDPTVRRLASEAKGKVEQHQATMRSKVKGPSETFIQSREVQAPRK
ncbi:MAG: HEAT repeat domain-containing protein [Candidatus Binatia bacterium]